MKRPQYITNANQVVLGRFTCLFEVFHEQHLEMVPSKLLHYLDYLLFYIVVSFQGKNTSMQTSAGTDKPLPRDVLDLWVLLELHPQLREKSAGPEPNHIRFRDKPRLKWVQQKRKDLFGVTSTE